MDYLVSGRRRAYAGLAAMAMGAVALVGGLSGAAGATDEEPPDGVPVPDNPRCEDLLPGSIELIKIENPTDDTYTEGDFTVTIDVELVDGDMFVSFEANMPVNVVFVKAGNGGLLYEFEEGATSAEDLESPKDSISHISFCGVEDDTTTTMPDEETTTSSMPDEETTTSSMPDEETTTSMPDDDETTTSSTPDEETTTSMGSDVSPTTDDDDDNGGLPVTGSNTGLMVVLGGLLLAGGAALVATSRLRNARGEA